MAESVEGIGHEQYEILAAAWLHTPLGRALRNHGSQKIPIFDQLVSRLASGSLNGPSNAIIEGRYFMYHGSYVWADRYVVRVIEVDANDDQILTVTDTIRDTRSGLPSNRVARGALIFEDKCPQILLYGEENKRGLSLILGREPTIRSGTLDTIVGGFIVMQKGGEIAYRRCLMVRESADADAMIEQSGIFTKDDLGTAELGERRKMFEYLRTLEPDGNSIDPILNL